MPQHFFEKPILNSPYAYPSHHWELDDDGQPTDKILRTRRSASFVSPVPKPRKRKAAPQHQQVGLDFGTDEGASTDAQTYDPTWLINTIRREVDIWRRHPTPDQWQVTPETARLLHHWRHHEFLGIRPFFCQVEAVETLIWLTEVLPKLKRGHLGQIRTLIRNANKEANPDLYRIALKLATGAGKTMVMAMIIAWQTVNAVRRPNSKLFTRGFLVVAPGITIRDRLRVLQPNDVDSYYKGRELIPSDLLADLGKAKIVVTNYHAFKLRERMELSKGGRSLLQGRGPELNTLETEGQMIQRVMPGLMGIRNILVLNDEAHHCYREKDQTDDVFDLKGLKTTGVQQAKKEDKIVFSAITGWPGEYICAEGRYVEGDSETERRAGVFIGPEFGTVSRPDLVAAAREAGDAGFDVLIACAFNYDAHSADFDKLGRIPVLKAHMNADLQMADDLKNTGTGNLFVIFGEPDIDILNAENGQLQVKINGVDVFHPNSGEVRSSGPDGIACWFIDTDYNEESFFVRHAYFLGTSDPYKSLKTTLKAEIDKDAWETLYSDVSRAFDKPKSGRIAVKVINHLGDEVMKVFGVG